MKGSKIPTKDNEEDFEMELLLASNDVNQGDSPKISSEKISCIENEKETKVPKNCIYLDIEIFSEERLG